MLPIQKVIVIGQLLLNQMSQGVYIVFEHVRLRVWVKLSDEENKGEEMNCVFDAIVGVILLGGCASVDGNLDIFLENGNQMWAIA